jgi:hypothetical protein
MVQTPGIVVVYAPSSRYQRAHQQATYSKVAHRLAGLHDFDFAGPFEPSKSYPGPVATGANSWAERFARVSGFVLHAQDVTAAG